MLSEQLSSVPAAVAKNKTTESVDEHTTGRRGSRHRARRCEERRPEQSSNASIRSTRTRARPPLERRSPRTRKRPLGVPRQIHAARLVDGCKRSAAITNSTTGTSSATGPAKSESARRLRSCVRNDAGSSTLAAPANTNTADTTTRNIASNIGVVRTWPKMLATSHRRPDQFGAQDRSETRPEVISRDADHHLRRLRGRSHDVPGHQDQVTLLGLRLAGRIALASHEDPRGRVPFRVVAAKPPSPSAAFGSRDATLEPSLLPKRGCSRASGERLGVESTLRRGSVVGCVASSRPGPA